MRRTSALLSGCHLPIRGRVLSQVAGAEALRSGLTCPLSVCFPSPQSKDMLVYKGPCGLLAHVGVDRVQAVSDALCAGTTCSFLSLLRCSHGYKCPLSVTANQVPPSLCCPCPVLDPHPRAGGAHMDSEHISQVGCGGATSSESGLLLVCA